MERKLELIRQLKIICLCVFISLSGICMSELQKIEDILLRRKAISHTHNDNPTEFDYTKFV